MSEQRFFVTSHFFVAMLFGRVVVKFGVHSAFIFDPKIDVEMVRYSRLTAYGQKWIRRGIERRREKTSRKKWAVNTRGHRCLPLREARRRKVVQTRQPVLGGKVAGQSLPKRKPKRSNSVQEWIPELINFSFLFNRFSASECTRNRPKMDYTSMSNTSGTCMLSKTILH